MLRVGQRVRTPLGCGPVLETTTVGDRLGSVKVRVEGRAKPHPYYNGTWFAAEQVRAM